MPLFHFILILIGGVFLSCNNNFIGKEKFIIEIPIGNPVSTVEIVNIEFKKLYYKKFIIYELPYGESFQKNEILIYETIKYEYFIFELNEKHGYLFRNLTDSFIQMKNVDSLLSERTYYNFTFDSILNLKNNHEIKYNSNGEMRIKFFSQDETVDSIIANFNSKFKKLKFSLAPQLDTIFKSKLYKIEYCYKAKDRMGNNLASTFEIKNDKINNEANIRKTFRRYSKFNKF